MKQSSLIITLVAFFRPTFLNDLAIIPLLPLMSYVALWAFLLPWVTFCYPIQNYLI